MRNYIKQLYYLLNPNSGLFNYNLNFIYVFHTEYLFRDNLFKQLIEFCENYHSLTGSHAVNTIMPANNPRIKEGIKKSSINESLFIERVFQLSEVSTIGYHGHYHIDVNDHTCYAGEIHCNNFIYSSLKDQFKNDMDWFKKHKITHNGIFAPGWYFMNPSLMSLLIEYNFKTDYSLSSSKWFSNNWSSSFFHNNDINTGEIFKIIGNNNKTINCVPSLIGCHNTPFPQDFERNLLKIFNHRNTDIIGCLSIHDDDINVCYTLRCIEHMMEKWNANFISNSELEQMFNKQQIKICSI